MSETTTITQDAGAIIAANSAATGMPAVMGPGSTSGDGEPTYAELVGMLEGVTARVAALEQKPAVNADVITPQDRTALDHVRRVFSLG